MYVGGERRQVQIGGSNSGAVFPSAVLDTGVPLILTTSTVANGIYGAIGVGPGSDGQCERSFLYISYAMKTDPRQDYVPCTTPLNITISLDDRPELPLHPLDLTAEPPKDNNAASCVGLIQTADSILAQPNSGTGDMILGVPFMRNVYTVMAYNVPSENGTFPSAPGGVAAAALIKPRLGLMSLTDPTTALDEFHRVRVLNQPINNNPSPDKGNPGTGGSGKKISVGVIVLIAVVGFFGLCFVAFAGRWWFYRRKYRTRDTNADVVVIGPNAGSGEKGGAGEYVLARRGSKRKASEERIETFMKKQMFGEDVTMNSVRTQVEGDMDPSRPEAARKGVGEWDAEMGYRRRIDSGIEVDFDPFANVNVDRDSWSPADADAAAAAMLWADDTLVGSGGGRRSKAAAGNGVVPAHLSDTNAAGKQRSVYADERRDSGHENANEGRIDTTEEEESIPVHQRSASEEEARRPGHQRKLSVAVPLLGSDEDGEGEFGDGGPMSGSGSMAGVGTAGRSGRLGNSSGSGSADRNWGGSAGTDRAWWNVGASGRDSKGKTGRPGHEREHSVSVPLVMGGVERTLSVSGTLLDNDEEGEGEFGSDTQMSGSGSMAGVGTAGRSERLRKVGDGRSGSGSGSGSGSESGAVDWDWRGSVGSDRRSPYR